MKINPLSLKEVVRVTRGRLTGGTPGVVLTGATLDSRQAEPGDLFIAVVGERADGHHFVRDAFRRGAAAVLVQRWDEEVTGPAGEEAPGAVIRVADTAAALGELAAWRRASFNLPVVGVTGSVGKTSTKEMLAAVLATRYRTLKTEGNLNTEFGVPLTLLRLEATHEAAVLEMGMRGPGQIAELCRYGRPKVGVVTNVGPTHLELLGSIENIARAKQELINSLPPDGTAVLNGDDPWCREMAQATRARVLFFGREPAFGPEITAREIQSRGAEGIGFVLVTPRGEAPVELPFPGEHQVKNALAAAGGAYALGLGPLDIATGLGAARNVAGRSQVREYGRVQVIDDTYNASPASTVAALGLLAELATGRKIAVLGNMLELGDYSDRGHREVGAEAARQGVDLLVTVGQLAAQIAEGARSAGLPADRVVSCAGNPAALAELEPRLRAGDTVLVKGSRGMRMEEIVAGLRRRLEAGGQA